MTFYDVELIREGYSLRFESGDHTLDVDVSDISTIEYFEHIRRVQIVTKQNRGWSFNLTAVDFAQLKALLGIHHPDQ